MPLLLVGILVADQWRLLMPVHHTSPAAEYYPNTSFLQQVKADVPATERILVQGDEMPSNTGLVYGIRDWRAQDPMLSERAHTAATFLDPNITNSSWNDHNMFLEDVKLQIAPILGMSYFIFSVWTNPNTPSDDDTNRPTFTRLAAKDGLALWRAEGVPGFAYLSDNVQAVPGEKEAAAWMKALTWEQVRAYPALVEGPPGTIAAIQHDPAGSSPGNVTVKSYTPGHISLEVHATRPAIAVVAESWYPGWLALLDGQPIEDLRANYLSQGVVVPAGTHTLEFEYVPGPFVYGALLSVIGLVGTGGVAVWAWRSRRSSRTVPTGNEAGA